MSLIRGHKFLTALIAVAVIAGAGLAAAFVFILPHDAPATLVTTQPSQAQSSLTPTTVAGRWSIGSGSVAGYRVREQLARLSAQSDAVGRTSAITGSMTMTTSGGAVSVTAASFNADLTQLTSDSGMRDRRIRTIGLESDSFPTASFVLKAPITVPAAAVTGTLSEVSATGDMTLHGVTKSVTIPLHIQGNGNTVTVTGSLTFPFTDFGMTPPSVGGFVSVEDNATLEISLVLSKS